MLTFNLEKPYIQVDDNSCEIVALHGEPVAIGATVTGHPTPTIKWTLEGADVTTDESFILKTDGGDKHRLTIESVQLKHEGVYQITAANDGGIYKKEVTLIVRGMLCQ